MKYCININNKRYVVEVEKEDAAILSTTEVALEVISTKNLTDIQTAATETITKIVKPSEQTTEINSDKLEEVVKAPMTGTIIDIKVRVGSAVELGDTIVLLEAMKMQNEITAHVGGTVSEIKVTKGAHVSADDVIMMIR